MVILYNNNKSMQFKFTKKFNKKNLNKKGKKHISLSTRLNSQRLTSSNRQFLLSLGFKLK